MGETYHIQCTATGIAFTVHVHGVDTVFEVREANSHSWSVVFRIDGGRSRFAALRIDRIDGDTNEVLKYFMLLKLSGATPSFEVSN